MLPIDLSRVLEGRRRHHCFRCWLRWFTLGLAAVLERQGQSQADMDKAGALCDMYFEMQQTTTYPAMSGEDAA